MPVESEIVDADIDDEATEAQQLHVVADVDRPSWRSNTMLHLDMPSIELGAMRA